MNDQRLNSIEYKDLSSLIEDIKNGESDIPISEVAKAIESLWKGQLIKPDDFKRLYKETTECKQTIQRGRQLDSYQRLLELHILQGLG